MNVLTWVQNNEKSDFTFETRYNTIDRSVNQVLNAVTFCKAHCMNPELKFSVYRYLSSVCVNWQEQRQNQSLNCGFILRQTM